MSTLIIHVLRVLSTGTEGSDKILLACLRTHDRLRVHRADDGQIVYVALLDLALENGGKNDPNNHLRQLAVLLTNKI